MLNIAKAKATAKPTATMTPDEYLKYLKDFFAKKYMPIFEAEAQRFGFHVEIVDGLLTMRYTDLDRIKRHLKLEGFSAEAQTWLLDILSRPDHRERILEAKRKYVRLIEEFSRNAIGVTGPHEENLRKISLGFAPIPYLNAGAYFVPAGGNVILLNTGLIGLNHYAALMEQLYVSERARRNTKEEVNTLTREAYLEARRILGIDYEYPVSVTRSQIHEIYARNDVEMTPIAPAMTAFVVLHEYGHVACGHTDAAREWKDYDVLNPQQQLKRRAQQRRFEIEADLFAAKAIMNRFLEDPQGSTKTDIMHSEFLLNSTSIQFVFHIFQEAPISKKPELDEHPIPQVREKTYLRWILSKLDILKGYDREGVAKLRANLERLLAGLRQFDRLAAEHDFPIDELS